MPKGVKGSGPNKPALSIAKVGVCMPTRGLVHSRTLEGVLLAVASYDACIYLTHDDPIPDSFNDLVARALTSDASHIWIVEEDAGVRPSTLNQLMSLGADVAAADAPYAPGKMAAFTHSGMQLVGTTCMLVRREVFEKLGQPYFRAVARDGSSLQILDRPMEWGGQDVDFCIRAQEAGFSVVLGEPVSQYKVADYRSVQLNHGYHAIEEWPPVS